MKSRLTIDFRGTGIDTLNGGSQFEPVIRATVEDSEDPRDGLMRAFFEALGGTSNWLVVDINSSDKFGSKKAEYTIFPVTPNEFESTINYLKERLPSPFITDDIIKKLPSRFQIEDEVDYTTTDWIKHEFENAKKKSPTVNEDELEYTPHYGSGKIVAVKFTEGKVWYNVLDDYTGKVIEEIDSAYIKSFSTPQVKNTVSIK